MRKYLIYGGVIAVVVVMVISAIVLVGGQGKNNKDLPKIELTWWKPFQDRQDFSDLIAEFHEIYPNVTIKYVKKDIQNYEEDLLNAIASGNSPDIFTIHNDWLPKHIDKMASMPDKVMTLRQYQDTFVDVAASDFVKEQKIYALPLSIDVLALYYNKDILGSSSISEPPKTWAEVAAAVQKVTRLENNGGFRISGIAMGSSNNVNRATDVLSLLMLQDGTVFYDETLSSAMFDQQARFNEETYYPGKMALEYYTQYADPGKKTYTWNSKSDNSIDAFAQNKLAMMLSYSYMIPTIKSKAPSLNWGVASAPQTDATGLRVNLANYWGEGVSKSSTNQEASWAFLKFLTEKESLKKYYEKVKVPSSRKDLVQDQIQDTTIGVFAENVPTARSVYKPDANRFESIFLKTIDDVVLRNIDPQDALSNGAAQINLLLSK